MRIGVVADTHIPQVAPSLPRRLIEKLSGCDLILHAGDLVVPAVLDELSAVAPVTAVKGNMDSGANLPVKRTVDAGGFRIGLIHGWGGPDGVVGRVLGEFGGVEAIVFGHTHRPYCRRHGTILLFNPGTPTDPRFSDRLTYGILTLGPTIEGTIEDLS